MQMEEHEVGDLRTETQFSVLQDEVRNLRKAAACNRIIGCKLDVPFSQDIADAPRLGWHPFIVASRYRDALGYPRFVASMW